MAKVYVVEELEEEFYGTFQGAHDILAIFDNEDKAVGFIRDVVKEDRERIRSRHFSYCTIDGYLNAHYGTIRENRLVYSNTNTASDTRIYYLYKSYIVE